MSLALLLDYVVFHVFLRHPYSCGETYFQHALAALVIACRLLYAAGAAAVHGLLPCLCTQTASRTAEAVVESVRARKAAASSKCE